MSVGKDQRDNVKKNFIAEFGLLAYSKAHSFAPSKLSAFYPSDGTKLARRIFLFFIHSKALFLSWAAKNLSFHLFSALKIYSTDRAAVPLKVKETLFSQYGK